MFDSSAKYPYGLFDGLTRHLGSFDQCERIRAKVFDAKSGKIDEVRSKYCLVDVKFENNNERIGGHEKNINPFGSAWEAFFVCHFNDLFFL